MEEIHESQSLCRLGTLEMTGSKIKEAQNNEPADLQSALARKAEKDGKRLYIRLEDVFAPDVQVDETTSEIDIECAVKKVIEKWEKLYYKHQYMANEPMYIINGLIRCTAKLVFCGKFGKSVDDVIKFRLKHVLDICGLQFPDNLDEIGCCLNLSGIIDEPWKSFTTFPSSAKEDHVDLIWKREGYVLLEERLKYLIDNKVYEVARIVLEIFIMKEMEQAKNEEPSRTENNDLNEVKVGERTVLNYAMIYILLWKKNPQTYKDFESWSLNFLLKVFNSLIGEAEKSVNEGRKFPKIKQWKNAKQIALQFLETALWNVMTTPARDLKGFEALVEEVVAHKNSGDYVCPIMDSVLERGIEIVCTSYIYTIADVGKRKKKCIPASDVWLKFIKMYVYAIMRDINQIEKQTCVKDINTAEVINCREDLAERYVALSDVFQKYTKTSFQLLLTAHSLDPKECIYERLFKDTTNVVTNPTVDLKCMDSATDLNMSTVLYEDLLSVIHSSRLKSMGCCTSMEELKTLCKGLNKRGMSHYFGNVDLEFLSNLERFSHLEQPVELEEEDCVEKGYGDSPDDVDEEDEQDANVVDMSSDEGVKRRRRGRPPGPKRIKRPKEKSSMRGQNPELSSGLSECGKQSKSRHRYERNFQPAPKCVIEKKLLSKMINMSLERLTKYVESKERAHRMGMVESGCSARMPLNVQENATRTNKSEISDVTINVIKSEQDSDDPKLLENLSDKHSNPSAELGNSVDKVKEPYDKFCDGPYDDKEDTNSHEMADSPKILPNISTTDSAIRPNPDVNSAATQLNFRRSEVINNECPEYPANLSTHLTMSEGININDEIGSELLISVDSTTEGLSNVEIVETQIPVKGINLVNDDGEDSAAICIGSPTSTVDSACLASRENITNKTQTSESSNVKATTLYSEIENCVGQEVQELEPNFMPADSSDGLSFKISESSEPQNGVSSTGSVNFFNQEDTYGINVEIIKRSPDSTVNIEHANKNLLSSNEAENAMYEEREQENDFAVYGKSYEVNNANFVCGNVLKSGLSGLSRIHGKDFNSGVSTDQQESNFGSIANDEFNSVKRNETLSLNNFIEATQSRTGASTSQSFGSGSKILVDKQNNLEILEVERCNPEVIDIFSSDDDDDLPSDACEANDDGDRNADSSAVNDKHSSSSESEEEESDTRNVVVQGSDSEETDTEVLDSEEAVTEECDSEETASEVSDSENMVTEVSHGKTAKAESSSKDKVTEVVNEETATVVSGSESIVTDVSLEEVVAGLCYSEETATTELCDSKETVARLCPSQEPSADAEVRNSDESDSELSDSNLSSFMFTHHGIEESRNTCSIESNKPNNEATTKELIKSSKSSVEGMINAKKNSPLETSHVQILSGAEKEVGLPVDELPFGTECISEIEMTCGGIKTSLMLESMQEVELESVEFDQLGVGVGATGQVMTEVVNVQYDATEVVNVQYDATEVVNVQYDAIEVVNVQDDAAEVHLDVETETGPKTTVDDTIRTYITHTYDSLKTSGNQINTRSNLRRSSANARSEILNSEFRNNKNNTENYASISKCESESTQNSNEKKVSVRSSLRHRSLPKKIRDGFIIENKGKGNTGSYNEETYLVSVCLPRMSEAFITKYISPNQLAIRQPSTNAEVSTEAAPVQNTLRLRGESKRIHLNRTNGYKTRSLNVTKLQTHTSKVNATSTSNEKLIVAEKLGKDADVKVDIPPSPNMPESLKRFKIPIKTNNGKSDMTSSQKSANKSPLNYYEESKQQSKQQHHYAPKPQETSPSKQVPLSFKQQPSQYQRQGSSKMKARRKRNSKEIDEASPNKLRSTETQSLKMKITPIVTEISTQPPQLQLPSPIGLNAPVKPRWGPPPMDLFQLTE